MTDFSPTAWVRELRAIGYQVYTRDGWNGQYFIGRRGGGFGDEFFHVANRFEPTICADPTYHDRVNALLMAEPDGGLNL